MDPRLLHEERGVDLIDTDLILKSAKNLLVMFLGNPSFDQIPQIP